MSTTLRAIAASSSKWSESRVASIDNRMAADEQASGAARTPSMLLLGWAIAAYACMLAYASLAPFVGWQIPQAYTIVEWPRYLTLFDVLINILAYTPLGCLVALTAERRGPAEGPTRWWRTLLQVAAIGFVLSLLLELAQAFLPGRVSSPVDLVANTIGAVAGAAFSMVPPGRRMVAAALGFRRRYFTSVPLADWGLLLLVIWLAAQLNPAIPFFEAGMLAFTDANAGETLNPNGVALNGGLPNAYDPLILLPQVVGVALNVTAFALFVSLLTHPSRHRILHIMGILGAGFLAKLAMASMLLKTPQLVSSLSPATVIGVTSGLCIYLFFSGIRFRWRAFWAALFVFAGGVMVKLASVYAALDQALRLFNWPYGQLANFAGLTSWLNEIWPLAALVFLAIVFVSNQPEHS